MSGNIRDRRGPWPSFCRWLSANEGQDYRLPTEAEWEWACRAGTTTHYSTGDEGDTLRGTANVCFHDYPGFGHRRYTLHVGSLKPNGFGLYDMHGNVLEWCADWYAADYYAHSEVEDPQGPGSGEGRVVRDGSFELWPWFARSAHRAAHAPAWRCFDLGFRVAMSRPGVP